MLNKQSKLLRLSALSLAVAGAMSVAPVANAEVSASAGVANMYFHRGRDFGGGSAQVSGDLVYSNSGAYGGVWATSGDSALGSEYDLFVGYGGETGGFSYDLSVWGYQYPGADISFGEASEAVLTVGYGAVSFTIIDDIATGSGYMYYAIGATYEAFSATLGMADYDDEGDIDNDYTHLDLSYSFNDNLTFTVSQMLDLDDDADPAVNGADDDTLVVVAYSFPIDM